MIVAYVLLGSIGGSIAGFLTLIMGSSPWLALLAYSVAGCVCVMLTMGWFVFLSKRMPWSGCPDPVANALETEGFSMD